MAHDPRRSTRRATALVTLAVALLLVTRPALAGPFDLNDATWEGCTDLLDLARKELSQERVVVLSTLDWEQLEASDGVLVLHPVKPLDAEEAAAFMKAGGRMAILDDYGRGDRLLKHFKIARRGLPGRPAAFIRGKPALAVATPAIDVGEDGEVLGIHPTAADVKRVVLNHATGLRHPNLTPVLEVRAAQGDPVTVAVAGQIDGPDGQKGRLFAMGDPSAFINLMLRYPGNRAFAAGVIRYLADGDSVETRKGKLYIVANEFGERGSFGGATPLSKEIDRKLAAFVEALEELRDQGFPWYLHVIAAVIAALLILWWVVRTLARLYKSRLPRFARPLPLVAQSGAPGRIAMLSSPVTPPALALLELRDALVEALVDALEADPKTPPETLIDQLHQESRIDGSLRDRARQMLASMRAADTAVVADAPGRVSRDEVSRAAAAVEELLLASGIDVA